MLKVISLQDCPLAPWKNGAGVTRELLRLQAPDGEFYLRISVAQVSAGGPFSLYPHHRRWLTILKGSGIKFISDTSIELKPFTPFLMFDGSESIRAELLGTEVQDFNVFVRKDLCAQVELKTLEAGEVLKLGPDHFVYLAQGRVEVNGERYSEVLLWGAGEQLTFLEESCLIEISLRLPR